MAKTKISATRIAFSVFLSVVAIEPAFCQSATDSWKFFRGENFDGVSDCNDIADSWDKRGPPILWAIDLGSGYSGFVGVNDRVYTQYQSLTGQYVVCLNAKTGEKIWEHRYGWPYKPASLYPGPRSTPTIAGERIYFTTPSGEVGCLDIRSGESIWMVSLKERFDAPDVEFGYACSPVIHSGKLVLPSGGKNASMVALDLNTGATVWRSGDYKISYCSAFPIQFDGQDLIVGYFKNELCLFDGETGVEVCSAKVSEAYDEHSAWPIYREPYLWASGPFRAGCQLFELKRSADKVRLDRVYKKDEMSNDVASCVLVGDSLYGFDIRDVQSKVHRPSRGRFCCLDFLTGEIQWQNGTLGRRKLNEASGEMISSGSVNSITDIGHASVVVADGKLIMLNDTGTLIVGHVDENEYREIGRWPILGGEIIWTAPSVMNRCIFARNQTSAVCVYLGPLDQLDQFTEEANSIDFASEIDQPEFLNLAPLILGTEPKFAMTAPKPSWLVNWFLWSLFLGWVISPILAVFVSKMIPAFSPRRVFLVLAFLTGIFGTTVLGRVFEVFYFSWPIALAIVFECLVCQLENRDPKIKTSAIKARIWMILLLAISVFYFWICRKLSLAFEWSFLMGFPAALPFFWVVKGSVQKLESFSSKQWFFSALGFASFYWAGAGVIMWVYAA